ncbi:hypothetical protein NBRGN_057_03340 [Nocardia brasiliensis NBRC 14402]|nr:hypothetical protein NBRGN_057_03340 [Nocardia brasiliensis NBRC 14402]
MPRVMVASPFPAPYRAAQAAASSSTRPPPKPTRNENSSSAREIRFRSGAAKLRPNNTSPSRAADWAMPRRVDTHTAVPTARPRPVSMPIRWADSPEARKPTPVMIAAYKTAATRSSRAAATGAVAGARVSTGSGRWRGIARCMGKVDSANPA